MCVSLKRAIHTQSLCRAAYSESFLPRNEKTTVAIPTWHNHALPGGENSHFTHVSPYNFEFALEISLMMNAPDPRNGDRAGSPARKRSEKNIKAANKTSLDWLKGKSTGNYGFYHQI
jgi:hypothetical protein